MINWIKTHKLILVLFLVIALLLKDRLYPIVGFQGRPVELFGIPSAHRESATLDLKRSSVAFGPASGVESQVTTSDRVVIQESSLSMVVNDVRKTRDEIIAYVKGLGGFMVQSSYNRPEESPYASITVRVPTEKLDESLKYFRARAVKVTNETLLGTDVTESYRDLETRLETVRKTQVKFNELLAKATEVQDILTVQRELITLQDQIDQVIGEKQAIERNTQLTRITIYLASDELALPYVPDQAFRPAVIFKQAVRNLVETLRWVGGSLIWVGVYSVVWVPILLGYVGYRYYRKTHN